MRSLRRHRPQHPFARRYGAIVSLALAWAGDVAVGQVVTDGSLGAATTLNGPNFQVPATLGRQVGGNLFHSFARMDVAAGESLTFAGPPSVERVLARVTNGSPTTIDGTIRCTIAGADVYLINRAGVAFGPSAALDVDGSFAVTTADVIRFADGGTFAAVAATPLTADVLTSAHPTAFGFLAPVAGAGIISSGAQLGVKTGKSIVLAGGEIHLTSSLLVASGGAIEIAGMTSSGELAVDVGSVDVEIAASNGNALGPVDLVLCGVDVSGTPAGRVTVLAKDLTLSATNVSADSFGDAAGRGLHLRAAGSMAIGNNSRVSATAFGVGAGAEISLDAAGLLTIDGGSSVFTNASGFGAAGNVTIDAGSLQLSGDAAPSFVTGDISSTVGAAGGSVIIHAGDAALTGNCFLATRTFSMGHAGNIELTATGTLHIDQGAAASGGIFAEAEGGSTGAGGDVRLEVARLQLDKGSIATSAFGAGPAGAIDVRGDDIQLGGQQQLAIISAQTTTDAEAGAMHIRAGALRLAAGGQFGTSTFSGGRGGAVDVDATDLSIDGMNTGFFTGLFTQTQSSGDAGPLRVNAETVRIINGGSISTITSSAGAGGAVSFTASKALAIEGGDRFQTGILSKTTLAARPAGRGGDITLASPSIRLANGAILASSEGEGDSGAISVTAASILMQDVTQGAVTRSQISTAANGAAFGGAGGAGGDIQISAGSLEIRDGAFVTTESFTNQRSGDIHITATDGLTLSGAGAAASATRLFELRFRLPDGSESRLPVADTSEIGTATLLGPAGNIVLDVGRLDIESNAYISASTGGVGRGGDIDIHAAGTVHVAAAGSPFATGVFVASLLQQSGPGGSVRLAAHDVEVVDGGIISGETFGAAPGGNVTVAAADHVLLSGAGADGPTGISVQTEGAVGGPGGALRIESDEGSIDILDRAVATASTFGSGAGGPVTLQARNVNVDGGFVSSVSRGVGAAGSVTVLADRRVTLRGGGAVSTSADQTSGGNIEIKAGFMLDLLNSRIAASAGQNGGNLSIDPRFVLLNRSSLAANAVQGNGGNMDISAGTFLRSEDSTIDVSSRFGLAGTVSITAPDIDVAGALSVLPGSLAGAEARLLDLCGARAGRGGVFSSFIVTARGGAPLSPGAFEPSLAIAADRDFKAPRPDTTNPIGE